MRNPFHSSRIQSTGRTAVPRSTRFPGSRPSSTASGATSPLHPDHAGAGPGRSRVLWAGGVPAPFLGHDDRVLPPNADRPVSEFQHRAPHWRLFPSRCRRSVRCTDLVPRTPSDSRAGRRPWRPACPSRSRRAANSAVSTRSCAETRIGASDTSRQSTRPIRG